MIYFICYTVPIKAGVPSVGRPS